MSIFIDGAYLEEAAKKGELVFFQSDEIKRAASTLTKYSFKRENSYQVKLAIQKILTKAPRSSRTCNMCYGAASKHNEEQCDCEAVREKFEWKCSNCNQQGRKSGETFDTHYHTLIVSEFKRSKQTFCAECYIWIQLESLVREKFFSSIYKDLTHVLTIVICCVASLWFLPSLLYTFRKITVVGDNIDKLTLLSQQISVLELRTRTIFVFFVILGVLLFKSINKYNEYELNEDQDNIMQLKNYYVANLFVLTILIAILNILYEILFFVFVLPFV